MKRTNVKTLAISALLTIIAFNSWAQPANDNCANAITLTVGATCSYSTYTTAGATQQAGIPAPGCASYSGGEVWFRVTVPASGHIKIDSQTGVITDGGMAIYSGTCPPTGMTLIECDDDDSPNGLMPMIDRTGLTPGSTIWIMFWEYGNDNNGTFGICVSDPPAAVNNECTTSTLLTVNPNLNCGTTTAGTIAGATASAQANGCGGTANDDVWYRFVATSTTHYIDLLNVAGSTTDLYHSVYAGTCAAPGTALICSDPNNSVVTGLTIGITYYVRVYSWGSTAGQTTTFDICIGTPPPPPANDNCTGAIALTPGAACTPTTGTIASATQSLAGCVGTANNDVWYSFVAQNSTQYINVTPGSGFDPVVQLFSGTCASLTSLSCNDASYTTGTSGTAQFTGLTVGQTYYYRIYDYYSTIPTSTSFTTCVTNPPSCPGGLGTGTFSVASLPYTHNGQTTCGDVNDITSSNVASICGSSSYYGGEDAVYYFTPSTSGNITISVTSSGTYMGIMLYNGCPFSSGSCAMYAQSSAGNQTGCVGVTAGQTYYLIIDSWPSPTCNPYSLNISAVSPGLANDEPCNATPLTVGATCTYTNSTNACAGASAGVPAPGCANYQGGDVWFTAVVPANGSMQFNFQAGTMVDNAMAAYSGTCSNLTLIACTDNTSLQLQGLTPGSTIWLRMWEYGNDANGTFGVCAQEWVVPPASQSDCLGAIPVCTNFYNPATSAVGVGTLNEITGNPGCFSTTGEHNTTWYVFTVNTSGQFLFTINSAVDYDWALWNMTNNNCTDIANNTLNMVSCNWSATTGNTGLSAAGTLNSQGAGGTVWNAPLNVTVGQSYVLMVDNFTGGATSYTLNFGGTAGIYDNTPPAFQSVVTPVPCGSNQLTFNFSENVNCATATAADFTLSGPGGPYTITGISSVGCASGAAYDNTYTVTVNPPLTTSGTFTLSLVNTAGSVADACNNTAPPASFNFLINNISSTSTSTNPTCLGGNNGTASATGSGGTAPYSYSWSTGATTQAVSGLAAGTYTCTVSDANGCQSIATVTIVNPSGMTLSITPTHTTCGSSNGAITVSITSGASPSNRPYDYQWSNGSSTMNTNSTTNSISGLAAGSYTVTVTDNNGCSVTATTTINASTPVTAGFTYNNNQCLTGNSFNFTNTGSSGGGITYSWTFAGGTPATSTAQNPTGITFATAGPHAVTQTVTGPGPCTATSTVNITVYPQPTLATTQSNVLCNSQCNGQATVNPSGGSAPYSYAWSNSQATQTTTATLCAGTFTVTVSDANTCTATTSVTITQPAPMSLTTSRTNVTCNGLCNGTAQVTVLSGGTAPFSYNWSAGTTPTASSTGGLCANNYTVTVTDANNCTATASVNISQPPALTANITAQTNILCNGGSTGQATVTAGGGTSPYTYLWNDPAPAQTTATCTGLTVGTWTVTVTDVNNCTVTATVNITQPPALTASISAQTNVSCNGGSNGQATVAAGGGTAPYSYLWNDPAPAQTTATCTGLTAGTWTVTVTDANNCTAVTSVTITQPPVLTASISGTNPLCNGAANGAANLTAGGGTPGYTYLWSNAATSEDLAGITAGTYSVTVTDASNCTATASVTLTAPVAVTASISAQTNVSCNGGSNGQATVTPAGGTAPYTYLWNDPAPAQTTATCTGLTAGTWTVTVTDANNCTATASVTITQPTVLSASISAQTNVLCNGGNNGQATVTPAGGTAPYTYLWNDPAPAQTTATCTGLTVGTWTVTVTDANNCTAVTSVTITQPPTLTASISAQTNVSCNGGSNGQATVAAGGGTAPYSYLWNDPAPAQTTATCTGLTAGTWTVTVTDANNCTAVTSVTITQPPVLTASITGTNPLCNGAANGAANLTAGGGTPGYTYLWSNAATSEDLAGITAGTYSVTVTDASNCTATASVTLTAPVAVTASISAQTNVSCNGGSNGQATVTPAGGTAPYTYLWNDPAPAQTTATCTGLTAGTWTVTVTDANNCTATASVTITQPTVLSASISAQTNVLCNGGNNGQATVTPAGGTAPYTYLWNDPAPAQTTATCTGLTVGTWTVTVTDANNCTAVTSVTITQPPTLTASISAQTNVSCNGGSNGQATVAAGGGTAPYSYLWNDPAPAQTTATCTGLTAGTWTVTVTDANNCTVSASVTITQPTLLTATASGTAASCNGGTNGTASASPSGGTAPYTYLWSNLQTTQNISGLSNGTYTVTITDANSCTTTATYTVNQPAAIALTPSSTDATCGNANGAAGVAVAGGTSPYTYLWTNSATTSSISGVIAGSYTVTVTDANTCTQTITIAINNIGAPSATITASTNALCNGACNGTATVSASGGTPGYTYLWSNGNATTNASALCAGTVSVTVTDALNCVATASVVITQPTALAAAISASSPVSCNGGSNGSATVSASGGTTGYTYLWTGGQTTPTATGLSNGSYTVTVSDVNLCTATATVNISQPAALTASITANVPATCNGGSNGSLTVTAGGGTPSYSYLWTGGQTSASATGLAAGTYAVTITDNNGCTATTSGTITEPAVVTANITTSSNVLCNSGNTGSATVSGGGGTPGYTYVWTGGQTNATATGLSDGTYSVTVTDSQGCSATTSVNITQPASLNASISASNPPLCNGGNNGNATATGSGGTLPYSYLWTGGQSAATATGLAAGTYTVTITDNNGCTATATTTLSQPPALTASIAAQTNVSCNGGNNGSATVSGSGGTMPYTYLWTGGQTSATATGLSNGTYSVTITDANNCTATTSVNITQPTLLAASTTAVDVDCNGGTTGSVNLTASGGTSPYTFLWSNSATSEDLSGLAAGTYTVTITDANGCTTTTTQAVAQPTVVTVSITAFTDATGAGSCDGTATAAGANGTPGYTYSWSNGQTSSGATGLCAGTYTVTVTDANGCTAVATITIAEPNSIGVNITSSTNNSCNASCDGTATAAASGGVLPYSYLWSNGQTTATATGLCAGTQSVTVTDNNGYTGTASVIITEPVVLTASIATQTNVSCNGGNNGSATVSGSGGTMPYTYLWTGGQTTVTATGLSNGTYSVTVTDANNCTTITSATITQPTPLTASTTAVNVSCNGSSTGSVNLTVTGGTPAYTYSWSNTATSEDISGLAAGTYNVTITDANSCTTTTTATITQPSPLTLSTSTVPANCGNADGSATVTASGGTAPYNYAWTGGQTTATATGLAAGVYTVTVTDASGCIQNINATISDLAGGSASITASAGVLCNGGTNGTATASMPNASSYVWDNGETTATATALSAGPHNVTVTDINGCISIASITINQPSIVSVTSANINALCQGAANGSINLTVSGGSPGYTFVWSNGATTEDISGVAAGNYSVTVSDNNGCTQIFSTTVDQPTALTSSVTSIVNASCFGGSNGTATVSASGGTVPYTYLWNGGSDPTSSSNTGLSANNYSITITDNNGCTVVENTTITEPSVIMLTASATDENCGQGNGTATVTASGGTPGYTYLWNGGTIPANASITGLNSGTYIVTVTDQNSCTQTASVVVTNVAPGTITISSQNNTLCNGSCDGNATVSVSGGAAPYTYNWTSGSTSATAGNLCTGTYTVSVTDQNNCTLTTTVTISHPTLLSAAPTYNLPLCFGSCNATIDANPAGGTAPYYFQWNDPMLQTTQTAINLCAGSYSVTITDDNGCSIVQTQAITNPLPMGITGTTIDAHCGLPDGEIDVTVTNATPPVTYLWSNGLTVEDPTGITAGSYTVTATDSKGCTATATFSINDQSGPSITASVSAQVSCFNACNGTASVTASGGIAPYTYLWTSGNIGITETNLCAGTHSVTVTDASGCSASASVSITQPAQLVSNTSQTNPACFGNCNGTASVLVTGGTLPYTYLWSSGAGTATATGLCAGNYTVITTDANNCTISNTVIITQPPIMALSVSNSPPLCSSTCNGTATVTPAGGTPPYTYNWNDPGFQTTQTAMGLCGGSFTVTVTDNNGCTTSIPTNLISPATVSATINISGNATCFNSCNAFAQVSPTGGNPPYTFVWSNGSATQSISGVCAGNYVVTVSDNNNCTATTNITLNQPTQLNLTLNTVNETCYQQCNGTVQTIVSGGTPAYTYSWSNGMSTSVITALCQGTYNVTVTDMNGCSQTGNSVVSGPTLLSVNPGTISHAHCGQPDGSATVNIMGGIAPYTYTWNPNVGATNTITNVYANPYTVTVTDFYGCTATTTVNINNINGPVITGITQTNVSCYGMQNGTATVSYTSPSAIQSVIWNDPMNQVTVTATNLAAGTYTVEVTDINGCEASSSVTITQPPTLNANIAGTSPASCFGSCNGNAVVVSGGGTPPYTYQWTDPAMQTTQMAQNLCAGFIMVNVTDQNGCTAVASGNISQPQEILVNLSGTNPTCPGSSNGTMTASVTGGTAPYGYNWMPYGGTGSVTGNLPANTLITVIVTDANGCTSSRDMTLSEPAAITASFATQPTTCGLSNGSAQVSTISGGTAPYSYYWSPSGSTQNFANNLQTGTHIVNVTDANNCQQSFNVNIINIIPPALNTIVTAPTSCNGSNDGYALVSIKEGLPPYTFIWAPYGSSDSISNNLVAGTYTVTIIDASGCSVVTPPIVITQPSPVVMYTSITDTICIGQSVTITASAGGGTPPYTYSWNNGLGTGQSHTVSPASGTTYLVTATDANGCVSSIPGTVGIFVRPPIALSMGPDGAICEGQTYPMTPQVTGGLPPYSYFWSNGLSGNSVVVSPNTTTTYYLTVSDACNSPQAVDSLTVTISPAPVITPLATIHGCEPLEVFLDPVITSSTPVTYNWNFGDYTSGPYNTSTDSIGYHNYSHDGNYTVTLTVTSTTGCQATSTFTNLINVHPIPQAEFWASPNNVSIFNATIHFYNQSSGGNMLVWTFGDGNSATVANPVNIYQLPGTYNVLLVVASQYGCIDSVVHPIVVQQENTFYAPDAFSPGGGLGNEYFYPKGIGFDHTRYEMWIFDRWGQAIFYTDKYPQGTHATDEMEGGWNGRINGTGAYAPIGTYVWQVKYWDVNNLYHEHTGTVTVVR